MTNLHGPDSTSGCARGRVTVSNPRTSALRGRLPKSWPPVRVSRSIRLLVYVPNKSVRNTVVGSVNSSENMIMGLHITTRTTEYYIGPQFFFH